MGHPCCSLALVVYSIRSTLRTSYSKRRPAGGPPWDKAGGAQCGSEAQGQGTGFWDEKHLSLQRPKKTITEKKQLKRREEAEICILTDNILKIKLQRQAVTVLEGAWGTRSASGAHSSPSWRKSPCREEDCCEDRITLCLLDPEGRQPRTAQRKEKSASFLGSEEPAASTSSPPCSPKGSWLLEIRDSLQSLFETEDPAHSRPGVTVALPVNSRRPLHCFP
ncbi:uncharacterized protein [Desmodus rotundus]|uniref:uncharacterized protein n=1 Tax=Desmodus rotundus TaxID=9430 RepID=UPI00238148F9|nr:uncharacterized protein LOC128779415 [Desmodus rotundus]